MKLQSQIVPKSWGHEDIFVSRNDYCGKILNFNSDTKCSLHYHLEKDETWYILSGEFSIRYIDTLTGTHKIESLNTGDIWRNTPGLPHQIVCHKQGQILEVSTRDQLSDNYRIYPGGKI